MESSHPQQDIATVLLRSASSMSRELQRNKGLRGCRPGQAQQLSNSRRNRVHKARKIDACVRNDIETRIWQKLSPRQILGCLSETRSYRCIMKQYSN